MGHAQELPLGRPGRQGQPAIEVNPRRLVQQPGAQSPQRRHNSNQLLQVAVPPDQQIIDFIVQFDHQGGRPGGQADHVETVLLGAMEIRQAEGIRLGANHPGDGGQSQPVFHVLDERLVVQRIRRAGHDLSEQADGLIQQFSAFTKACVICSRLVDEGVGSHEQQSDGLVAAAKLGCQVLAHLPHLQLAQGRTEDTRVQGLIRAGRRFRLGLGGRRDRHGTERNTRCNEHTAAVRHAPNPFNCCLVQRRYF